MPYEISGPGGETKTDIFLIKLTSGTTIDSHKRLTYSGTDCLAVRTLTDGTAYALFEKVNDCGPGKKCTDITLLLLDFNSNTYKQKEKSEVSSDWELKSAFAKFAPTTGSADFYMSAVFWQDKFKDPTGLVLSSMTSRRGSDLLPSSFSSVPGSDISTDACSSSACVTVGNSSSAQSKVSASTSYYTIEFVDAIS